MKRSISYNKKSNKKSKKEEKVNPFSLVLKYINKRNNILNSLLICKEWKNILENHDFWKRKNEKFEFGSPELKARKYKTHYSIFLKNSKKLCGCHKELLTGDTLIRDIYFKIHILEEFCENRNEFYKVKPYNNFIFFVEKEIEKVIEIIKNEYYYRTDFFNIIIHNLYKIINKKDLYIERFGGFIKDFNHTILKFVDYDALKQEKEEEGLYDLLNPNYRKFIENY
ncbi:25421_t:CDS:2 [Gigaspora margarita]|uniref:25421_t:CDS:1 n=1 Tax=Gigaspora margarita TaxID=4874 RepID=A0ABN7W4B2_GIGMA|nr:25421_t:CDS:2 [Gigaspora margarita]